MEITRFQPVRKDYVRIVVVVNDVQKKGGAA